jgi:RNA polymerase sigma factor (sigma-70 family)
MSLDDRAAVRAAVDEGAGARTRALRRECGEVLEAAVGLLPHNERAIMELFYWQGMGYGEIAVLLRTTVGQVGKKLFRARRKLREMLLEKGIKNSADVWE